MVKKVLLRIIFFAVFSGVWALFFLGIQALFKLDTAIPLWIVGAVIGFIIGVGRFCVLKIIQKALQNEQGEAQDKKGDSVNEDPANEGSKPKSKFQLRLEDMQRQQQEAARLRQEEIRKQKALLNYQEE